MRLKRNLVKQNSGFAIEARPETPWPTHFCERPFDRGDNWELKKLIVSCREDTEIRELTKEERAQIEQYKAEQRSKPVCDSQHFKIVT